jgi:hypothetical protein
MSSIISLETPEKFEEENFGKHLPDARKNLMTWQALHAAAKRQANDVEDNANAVTSDIEPNKTTNSLDSVSPSDLSGLMTEENFPESYGADIPENNPTEDLILDDHLPFYSPNSIYRPEGYENGCVDKMEWSISSNKSEVDVPKKLFPKWKQKKLSRVSKTVEEGLSASNDCWKDKQERIQKLIPGNASGVAIIMGRRVNLDTILPDASLERLLQAWVEDDPKRNRKCHRKSLMEHAEMAPLSSRKSSSPLLAIQEPVCISTGTTTHSHSLDILGWLNTPLSRRNPYPEDLQVKVFAERSERKRKRDEFYKVRRERARQSLILKGFKL